MRIYYMWLKSGITQFLVIKITRPSLCTDRTHNSMQLVLHFVETKIYVKSNVCVFAGACYWFMCIWPWISHTLLIYLINNPKANFKPPRKPDYAGYSMETSCLLDNLNLIAVRFNVDRPTVAFSFVVDIFDFCIS